jgi:hypothetical protein
MGRTCSTYGEMGNAYNFFIGIPQGKISLGRPRHNLEDSPKVELKETW